MSGLILLVTGSRAMDDLPRDHPKHIRAAAIVEDYVSRSDTLVVGDANAGADRWAWGLFIVGCTVGTHKPSNLHRLRVNGDVTQADGRCTHQWGYDGSAVVYGGDRGESSHSASGRVKAEAYRVKCLERNAAMALYARRLSQELHGDRWRVNVIAVGIVAPWSRTEGTDHTLGHCKRAGITIRRRECILDPADRIGAIMASRRVA